MRRALLALLLSFVATSRGWATEVVRDHATTSGPALGLALGPYHRGFGVELAYLIVLGARPLTLELRAGLGIAGGNSAGGVGGGGGVALAYGRHSRAVLGLGYGLLRESTLSLHGTPVDHRGVYGPGIEGGYELIVPDGLTLRACVGLALMPRAPDDIGWRIEPTVLLVLGWKLW